MKSHTIPAFKVVGISARIANKGNAGKEVEALWGRFWGEDIRSKVPNSVSEDIYAVYSDYESDHTGAYNLLIGLPVKSLDDVPEGFQSIEIQEDTYQEFISNGKMPEAILNTWMEIWADNNLNRSFRVDFTVHGEKYFDGDNAQVQTYISLK